MREGNRFGSRVSLLLGIAVSLLMTLASCISQPAGSGDWGISGGRMGSGGSAGGQEMAVPAKTATIPPHKVWDRQFTLNDPATITVEWRIEPGASLDYYFVTREQDQRASQGYEPTRPGEDFIRYSSGIVGSGSAAETLRPGEYHIIFRNLGDAPVTVWSRALGERSSGMTYPR